MNELLTKELGLRSVDQAARTVDFIASTSAVDSYGEVVEQSWRLERYKQNPIVLFGHNSRELPIGTCLRTEVNNGQLECTIKFLPESANPKAEQVWQCVQAGALRAVSVGFMPGTERLERRNGKDVFVLSDNELHEVSVVPLPANPEALARMRMRARKERETMGDESNEVNELRTKNATYVQELSELRATCAALTSERDAARSVAKEAEMHLVGAELDILIGKKITPAERGPLLELAAANRTLFDKQMLALKSRPDMKLLHAVVTGETQLPPSAGEVVNSGDLLARIRAMGA